MEPSPPNDGGTSQQEGSENWTNLRNFAALVGKSYITALKLAKSGKVKAIKVGGTYRIYESEVRRFLRHGNRTEEQIAADRGTT